jgi:CheY-like chemotaxis protein
MTTFRKILLVDDNPRDTELILDALSSYNLTNEVVSLTDGSEALDYLYCRGTFQGRDNAPPAFILLDLKMPKVDGIDVLRQVKSDSHLRTIPIVVMTSSRQEQDLLSSYELGVNAYVVKPVRFQEFVEAVRQLGIFWAILNEPPIPMFRNHPSHPGSIE